MDAWLPKKPMIVMAVVVIILIALIYWKWFRGTEDFDDDETPRRRGKTSKKTKERAKPKPKKSKAKDEHMSDIEEDAKTLYGLVHENMVQGMTRDEFQKLAEDLAGDIHFNELLQLYTVAKQDDQDPQTAVTVKDYVAVLSKHDG
jgi:cytoskeletal protein RodZ